MAFSTPLTAVANTPLTAAQWNASVRDNLNETAPAKATVSGGIFVATGAGAIAQRATNADTYTGGGTNDTNSTSYTGLTGGAAVAITTGTKAIVLSTFRFSHDTLGGRSYVSHAISGATTTAASDTWAALNDAHTINRILTCSQVSYWPTLTSGSNTFTHFFRVVSNIASFTWRQLVILPF
jgi:hypothetical protein